MVSSTSSRSIFESSNSGRLRRPRGGVRLDFSKTFEFGGSKTWTFTAELQRRIQVMEMSCYRKILHISYKDHVTNEEVRARIQQAIGPHEDLLTFVKRLKLQWYGHVSRSSGLARTILQGTVKGGRRQDRQKKKKRKKRWRHNIKD